MTSTVRAVTDPTLWTTMSSCVPARLAAAPTGGGWDWACCSSAGSQHGCGCARRPCRRSRRPRTPGRGRALPGVLAALPRVRDKLLVAILAQSGMRIGEALGLRREDMHLLASNNVLGCAVRGPHIHVRRRANANGSLAKSRFPRSIPVTADVVDLYADYQFERNETGLAGVRCSMFPQLTQSRFLSHIATR
jgi:hypothetical protein